MIQITTDDTEFMKTMESLIQYSIGFADGIKKGETKLLDRLGMHIVETLNEFIDSNSRVNPARLHHVYEWNQVGLPSARLFEIKYRAGVKNVQISSEFRQSSSIKAGSKVPFYNKASIIENGIPVTIRPKNSSVLTFEDNGEQVFTKKPITIINPGGTEAQAGFEQTVSGFFNVFSQSFLKMSGIGKYLQSPKAFAKNFSSGKRNGRNVGVSTGYNWIINAGGNQ